MRSVRDTRPRRSCLHDRQDLLSVTRVMQNIPREAKSPPHFSLCVLHLHDCAETYRFFVQVLLTLIDVSINVVFVELLPKSFTPPIRDELRTANRVFYLFHISFKCCTRI